MRIILYTGKGGVGKTSVAAATALRCAELGHRTIVLSTDLAHSLADSLDVRLSAEPQEVQPNLWAQEVDVYHEVRRQWGAIQEYMVGIFAWRGLDDLVAEEMTIFPGMEEMASLLLITQYHQQGAYDVVIVDCAPTGETLRLLSFPEVSGWWLKNVFPLGRKVSQLIRPMVRPFTDMPLPTDQVLDSAHHFLVRLQQMHTLLGDPTMSTVRLVLNPEKMVIKEAQRTYTYLNLYGYTVDAVICNRMIPAEVSDSYFSNWKGIQEKYSRLVDECFAPLPVLRTPLYEEEVMGARMLRMMADSAFGTGDPAQVYFAGRAHSVAKEDDSYVLSIPLPFAEKSGIEVLRSGEELIVRVGTQRRNIILPRALVGLETREARFEGEVLRVRFA